MDSEINIVTKKNINLRVIFVSAALFILLYFCADSLWSLVGIDWKETYYPAARAVLDGANPYLAAPTFRNLP
ncbi:MAG TPA: hypothetical protein PKK96_12280 [Anaerolineales bacterium]|nr:hypothetical protein [Anaerolineales bacterium]HMS00174.1 hypothetical protein [Anaerolineales bacterium]HNQ95360.1 hypothetical protein [Anaerolineales bacterium]HNS61777.1 hypothetical protein [Anaerolineales bacterium]